MKDRDGAKAFDFIMKVVRNPDAYPRDFIALQRGHVARILTGERARLLDLLESHGPFSEMRMLAAALHRAPSAIARDVHYLEGFGLVERRREGKRFVVTATKKPVLLV